MFIGSATSLAVPALQEYAAAPDTFKRSATVLLHEAHSLPFTNSPLPPPVHSRLNAVAIIRALMAAGGLAGQAKLPLRFRPAGRAR
jgi:hypothetical protein